MGKAKDIKVRAIPSKIANEFVRKWHYSGKIVNNSCLHLGCFLDGGLHGVMSFGPSTDKRKMLNLVQSLAQECTRAKTSREQKDTPK